MLETSSRCSCRNQCRNCSPTRSRSSRASFARSVICCVTRLSCSRASRTGSTTSPKLGLRRGDGRDRHLQVGVEQVLDEHHRVVSLLDRLPVEVGGEPRERLRRRSRRRSRRTAARRRTRSRSARSDRPGREPSASTLTRIPSPRAAAPRQRADAVVSGRHGRADRGERPRLGALPAPDLEGSVNSLAYQPCEVEGSCPQVGQDWV